MTTDEAPRRRSGGRAARQAIRLAAHAERIPFLTRKLAPFEVLDDEGLSLIEQNADTILQEVGIEFRGDPAALETLRDGGADVQGERVRFPRGMCRQIVQASAPRIFTQYARNHDNERVIAADGRNRLEHLVAQHLLPSSALHVDDWAFSCDRDCFLKIANAHIGVDGCGK